MGTLASTGAFSDPRGLMKLNIDGSEREGDILTGGVVRVLMVY